jgi:hypothetical protein
VTAAAVAEAVVYALAFGSAAGLLLLAFAAWGGRP